jgi:hypothetical protein
MFQHINSLDLSFIAAETCKGYNLNTEQTKINETIGPPRIESSLLKMLRWT